MYCPVFTFLPPFLPHSNAPQCVVSSYYAVIQFDCITMDVETSSKVNGFHNPSSSAEISLDPDAILEYISSLLSLTLGATKHDLESDHNILSVVERDKTLERCSAFLTGPRVALYASKRKLQLPQANGEADGQGIIVKPVSASTWLELILPQLLSTNVLTPCPSTFL